MLFSARAEYACLAMLELAAQYGDPKPVRLTEIANKHGISSPRFLVQILIQLNKAGLVTSTRGAAGGYHIAKRPADITLADVVAAVEGTEQAGTRTKSRKPASPLAAALDDVWDRVRNAHDEFLKAQADILKHTTLAQLVDSGQPLQYVI
ncbi:HTH-type transcriptional regulator CymR [Gemmata sp. SH-PL17]|uniref:Rrf2 family transcriptional regulator n=1 Tax=Gemmata massiliana TaxID=1210884 RepID=A0A6P2CQY4_9BACT|nr:MULTISPECIES: Rrf2 family transcriptional regulator [Gemmata]AMV29327.1 HTH-type transcriptional regulator CymR [Gemmata sp. SH-PL17]VTR91468.1 Transcriptional regulator, BadM/Rrf2 family OS=Pirellula staleyi (strain ATCC 27377 / DSM 6068 / ICPB 4128) GN=Psta_0335 PE=4 SV=1: Rrf2 [Gemmata massiliana]